MEIAVDFEKDFPPDDGGFRLRMRFRSRSLRIVMHGPSGAGKSLLLKAIAGLIAPDRGRIALGGRTFFDSAARIDLRPQERRIAYVFQDYALFPHLNVRQNIGFGLRRGLWNPSRRGQDERVGQWLRDFGLEGVAGQYPAQLSGGQRQRTALARALIAQPDALLLDEPFAAFDPALRERLRGELMELQQRLTVPLLLITHDPEDVRLLGEHCLRIDNGAVAAEDGGDA